VAYRKRNPKTFWMLLSKSLTSHLQLAREWPRLRRQYRNAKPELTSLESWGRIFKG
jgi:galactofuranosylgalactofuranosylrhamnosyl-N-acetylglucosaminyl-diphospho-decaprenol beta-1,5/1,6-galactofuranosyltransferase